MTELSPTQLDVANALTHAAANVPVIHLTGESGFLANGKGTTTVLRHLAATLPSAALVDVSAGRQVEVTPGFARRGYHAFVAACLKAWESADVLLVDDIDLAAHPESIYSVRLGATGESFGFYQTASEPTLAIKLLAAHAVANGKVLIFRSVEDHFLRFIGQPFTVRFPAFTADDYQHFLQLWLPAGERAQLASNGGPEAIWRQYPQLSAADLRVACVPATADDAGANAEGPPVVLARIAHRLADAHGSVSLEKVDKKEVAALPGLADVMRQIERQ